MLQCICHSDYNTYGRGWNRAHRVSTAATTVTTATADAMPWVRLCFITACITGTVFPQNCVELSCPPPVPPLLLAFLPHPAFLPQGNALTPSREVRERALYATLPIGPYDQT
uniref:Uncharacterized protein n=1 Tax=Eutreptiella gymnastica TaxID=73025 RepID=A0A7S4LB67_9EUGL